MANSLDIFNGTEWLHGFLMGLRAVLHKKEGVKPMVTANNCIKMGFTQSGCAALGKTTYASVSAFLKINMNLKKQRNLAMAKNAVNYTMKKMTIGAANKNKDLFSSLGFSLFCVAGIRKTKESGSGLAYLRAIASESENAGCGNCAEQSAIAFIYMIEQLDL